MNKKKFESPQVTICALEQQHVICASSGGGGVATGHNESYIVHNAQQVSLDWFNSSID